MTLRIDICDRALQRIGAPALQTESAAGAGPVLNLYDDVVRFICGLEPWTFTKRTLALNEDLELLPSDFWSHRYKLPNDRIGQPLAYYDKPASQRMPGGVPFTEFELEGDDYVLTEATTLWCTYQVVAPPSQWPAVLREAITLALAAELAVARHEDHKTRAVLRATVYGDERVPGDLGLLGKASLQDAQRRPSPVMNRYGPNPLIDARR